MNTLHKLVFTDSRNLSTIETESIDLVVTSPPYPMIEMWDALFAELNSDIGSAIAESDGKSAFNLMHAELDKVWLELERIVRPSGFVCINIGDATRTLGDEFGLYSNHSRIINSMTKMSFCALPLILWRKTTNAPTKFMGSGMLPAGAYVTLEHEYILIFRKGGKRHFKTEEEKGCRNASALFWEERNKWFSDLWDLSGVRQTLNNSKLRERSAAYPFELSYRLINMYSVKGDMVLDPFLGTGTTMFSAMASERNSIGVEYDSDFKNTIIENMGAVARTANQRMLQRLREHQAFMDDYIKLKGEPKYKNNHLGFPVVARQEREMLLSTIAKCKFDGESSFAVEYKKVDMANLNSNSDVTIQGDVQAV